MKNFIKVLSALFSTTLAINCIFSISLLSTNAASLNEKQSEFEYAEKAVSTYLQSYKVNNDEIYISDSLDVYDIKSGLDTNDLYVVFNKDEVIGLLSVAYINDSYYSSFEYNNFESLQTIYNKKEEFNFVCNEEKLYINTSDITYSIDNVSEVVDCDFELATTEIVEKTHRLDTLDSSPTYMYGIVKKCAVRKHPKSKIGMYQAT